MNPQQLAAYQQQIQQMVAQQRAQLSSMNPQQLAQAQAMAMAMQSAASAASQGRPVNLQFLQNLAMAGPQNNAVMNALAAATNNQQIMNSNMAAAVNQFNLAGSVGNQNQQQQQQQQQQHNQNITNRANQNINVLSAASGVSQEAIASSIQMFNLKMKHLESIDHTTTNAQAKQQIKMAKEKLTNDFNSWKMSLLSKTQQATDSIQQRQQQEQQKTPTLKNSTPNMPSKALNLQNLASFQALNAAGNPLMNMTQQQAAAAALAKQAQQQLQNAIASQQQQLLHNQQQNKNSSASNTQAAPTPVLKAFQLQQAIKSTNQTPASPALSNQTNTSRPSILAGPPQGSAIFSCAPQFTSWVISDNTPSHGIASTSSQPTVPLSHLPFMSRSSSQSSTFVNPLLHSTSILKRSMMPQIPSAKATLTTANQQLESILSDCADSKEKKRLFQLLAQTSHPLVDLTSELEAVILGMTDDFVEHVTSFACRLSKHRSSDKTSYSVELNDLKLPMEWMWNLRTPGFSNEIRPASRQTSSQSHQIKASGVKRRIQDELFLKRVKKNAEINANESEELSDGNSE